MRKNFYSLAAACLLATTGLMAQTNAPAIRNCGTMETLEHQLQHDPGLRDRMNAIERHTKQFEQQSSSERASVISIPVVVHVVYNTTAQNISDAQIQSQITVLNNDFRKLNSDVSLVPAAFAPLAADAQIQFCMAKRDPAGNATTGITRTSTTKTSFSNTANDVKYNSTGGKDAWPRDQYLNIWVCNLSNNILGYAQFPGGAAATDGVVVTFTAFGTSGTASAPFNKGRTATHEVGHYLNLRHIWGDEAACGADDLVSDTPQQKDKNYGCPSWPQTTQAGGRCSTADPSSMYMNYMDYTDDACMYMFSTGQSTRMRAVLTAGGARSALATSLGCSAPATATCGVPASLTATSITTTTATLGWAAVSGATSYNVRLKQAAATTWSTGSTSGTSINATGLVAGTAYEFQVQAVCSGSSSVFSASRTFTTSSGSTSSVVTVGTGTATVATHPYGTYYMDERVQYIITKAELTAAGYTSGSQLNALAFYVTTASSQVMNAYTIKVAHTTATAFGSSSYLTGTGTTTAYTANYTAVANSWNKHTFGTPFTYDGNSNLLIDICFNNSSYTSNSSVRYTATSAYRALYKQQDVASGGICATTTGTLSYNRPNMQLTFSGGSAIVVSGDPNAQDNAASAELRDTPVIQPLQLFPNPVTSEMTVAYTLDQPAFNVQIAVYNMLGALVHEHELGEKQAGEHTFTISAAKDDYLSTLPNGMYICTVRHGETAQMIRFVLSR